MEPAYLWITADEANLSHGYRNLTVRFSRGLGAVCRSRVVVRGGLGLG